MDSIEVRLAMAAKNFEREEFKTVISYLAGDRTLNLDPGQKHYRLGFCYWNLELIGYCRDNSDEIKSFGKLALQALDSAEHYGADRYLCAGYKGLAAQILAGLGLRSGITYGPRASSELKKALKINPHGYLSRLADAVYINQAPKFAGGNPKQAVLRLEDLAQEFPDSVVVKIHLASAYCRAGRPNQALSLINSVLAEFPQHLLARKIAGTINSKK
ncbi:MAG: tetratricopeptide repeat protein [Candidatus Delongbacteria bacterium]|nr:tetratricopeptide repeat protein [Candidatus Delongbacteria bacterium]